VIVVQLSRYRFFLSIKTSRFVRNMVALVKWL